MIYLFSQELNRRRAQGSTLFGAEGNDVFASPPPRAQSEKSLVTYPLWTLLLPLRKEQKPALHLPLGAGNTQTPLHVTAPSWTHPRAHMGAPRYWREKAQPMVFYLSPVG